MTWGFFPCCLWFSDLSWDLDSGVPLFGLVTLGFALQRVCFGIVVGLLRGLRFA